MYSKVKILGHPLHPMLIAFPIAFYTATVVCYIAYSINANVFWFKVAYVANVAGVIMALLAAIPGFVDWAVGIPSETQAKRVGIYHLLLNVGALVLFAISAFTVAGQFNDPQPDAKGAMILTIIGLVFTLGAGYFGWTLVQTHHVGVDLTPAQERLEPTGRVSKISIHQPHKQPT